VPPNVRTPHAQSVDSLLDKTPYTIDWRTGVQEPVYIIFGASMQVSIVCIDYCYVCTYVYVCVLAATGQAYIREIDSTCTHVRAI
jgi:hypothetical protein